MNRICENSELLRSDSFHIDDRMHRRLCNQSLVRHGNPFDTVPYVRRQGNCFVQSQRLQRQGSPIIKFTPTSGIPILLG